MVCFLDSFLLTVRGVSFEAGVLFVCVVFNGETWFEEEEVGCVELPDPQYVSLCHCSLSPPQAF